MLAPMMPPPMTTTSAVSGSDRGTRTKLRDRYPPVQATAVTPPLTDVEVRVLGCLIEKEATTPDVYPLSLNALVNACNQSSNRDPVMELSEDAVRWAINNLRQQSLVRGIQPSDSRVMKYQHLL